MFDRIRALFRQPPADETLHPEEALDRFQEAKADRIAAVDDEVTALHDDIQQALDNVTDALNELKAYEHDNTRVADVTTNVAADRLRQIDAFEMSDDPEQLHTALDDLIDDMRAVSRKEQAVLDHVEGPVKQVFRQVDTLEDQMDHLGQFLDTTYSVVQARQELDDLVDRWHRLREERDDLAQERDAVDTATPRNRLQKIDEQLDALDDDPEQNRKDDLEQAINELEDRRDSLQQEVAGAASKMERGLKKLLYEVRNGDVSLPHDHVQVLETIRDGTVAQEFTPPAGDIAEAVDASLEAIDRIDLSDRQQNRFRDGADTLRNLADIRETLQDISDQIATKQDELDELTIDERRAELTQERERMERRLTDRRKEREQLTDRIEQTEDAIAEARQAIEDLLDDRLHDNITVKPADDSP
jgi:chromosome segregation ATPase